MNLSDRFCFGSREFFRRTLLLMLPVILQQLITIGINFMDNLMIGSFGEVPIAAAAFGNQVYAFFQFICMGLGSGAVVMSSQFWGRKGIRLTPNFSLAFFDSSMMKAASFSGFDFESTWNINENSTFSYPTLRNVINSEGQSSNSIIDAGHTWDSKYTIDKQPTCSEKGSGLIYCLERGDYKEVEIPIDPNAHSWGDWTETTPATCATGGVETRTCKHDATHTETRNTDPKQDAHDWDEWTKINDEQHQRVCRNDANHKETGDHSWDEGVETTPASETEDGVKTYTCNVCGATKTEDIPSQLVLAKQDALARLKQVNLNNYSGVERTKVENALKTAIEAIENATSVSEVTDAENAANGTIKAQKTDAQKAAEAKPNTKPEVVDLKAVKSLKVKGAKGKLTVKWKKAAKKELKTFQYYEIQYTLNGTFKDYPPKTVGKKKASVTVKKLLKKKKYTVRIRRCRDDGSVLHVSPWKVKKAKTK